jgi:hypothetical protein
MQQELNEVAQVLDPIRLLHQLEQIQQTVFRSAACCSPVISPIPSVNIRVFSMENCTVGKLPVERSFSDPTTGFETLYREQEGRKRVLGSRWTHKDPFGESGSRSSPGCLPILNGAAVISFGSCSAFLLDATNRCKFARFNEACGKYDLISWKREKRAFSLLASRRRLCVTFTEYIFERMYHNYVESDVCFAVAPPQRP